MKRWRNAGWQGATNVTKDPVVGQAYVEEIPEESEEEEEQPKAKRKNVKTRVTYGANCTAFPELFQRKAPVQVTSRIISISTGIPLGSADIPTAERACFPASPKSSTSRSEQPLTTLGWSRNSSVQ